MFIKVFDFKISKKTVNEILIGDIEFEVKELFNT